MRSGLRGGNEYSDASQHTRSRQQGWGGGGWENCGTHPLAHQTVGSSQTMAYGPRTASWPPPGNPLRVENRDMCLR